MYRRFFKRTIDIALSFIGLVVLIPVFMLTALAIKIFDPGPVIFKQPRLGKNKESFVLYKFRSMRVDTPQIATPDFENPEQYISKLGNFLRKTSIDELPQLWNILKGDMSIVGYRPLILEEAELNGERESLGVFDARPGLTGLAQISGRDVVDAHQKALLDKEYIENCGFVYDAKIFLKTIVVVLTHDGVVEGKQEYNKPEIEVVEKEKEEATV